MVEVKYLVKVDPANNNSKYYKMIPEGNSFRVEYGRLGNAKSQVAEYPIESWNAKYKEKLKKGYEDKSELIADLVEDMSKEEDSPYAPITNKAIAKIVQRLQDMARDAVQRNYQVSAAQVTQAMIDSAQELINALGKVTDNVEEFNNSLIELFKVLPRKMKTVKDNLANTKDDMGKIYQREQDLLDVMKGQVVQISERKPTLTNENKQTILEAMRIEFAEITAEEKNKILRALGDCKDKFYNAWKVENKRTQEAFDRHMDNMKDKTTKLLFHGSRSENWWSIINSGLVLRPNAPITGKMFGYRYLFRSQGS